MNERIIFDSPWTVSGKGSFTNVLVLGTFAPGDSPTISDTNNLAIGGTFQVELGGLTPGSGDNNHDQIRDSAMLFLFGDPTLEILSWNNFIPELGDEFEIMTWQTGLDGMFGSVKVDSWFTDRGFDFALHYDNIGGIGSLTIEAIPEPATMSLLAIGGLALLRQRRRRK